MTEGPFEEAGFTSDNEVIGALEGGGAQFGAPPRWGLGRKAAVAAGIAVALGAGGYGIAVAASGQSSTPNGNGTAAAGVPAAQDESGSGAVPAPGCVVLTMHGVSGTLKSDNGSTLTVQAPDNTTRTVTTTSSTVVVRTAKGTLADIANGDQVLVSGSYANNTITAQDVVAGSGLAQTKYMPSGFGNWAGHGTASGTVADKSSTGFTVDTSDGGHVAVTVPSSATISTTVKISVSALHVGQQVVASGTVASNGDVSATRVQEIDDPNAAVGPRGWFGPGPGGFGHGFPFGGKAVAPNGTPPTGMPTTPPSGLPKALPMPNGGAIPRHYGQGPCSSISPSPAPSGTSSGAADPGTLS